MYIRRYSLFIQQFCIRNFILWIFKRVLVLVSNHFYSPFDFVTFNNKQNKQIPISDFAACSTSLNIRSRGSVSQVNS